MVVSWIKQEVWVFHNHEYHYKKDTGVNARSGTSKVLVNCGRTNVSSWAQGMDHGKALKSCELRSGQYLHCTETTKPRNSTHTPPVWPREELRRSSRRSSGLSPQNNSWFMWKKAQKLAPWFLSLSHPLLSPVGLWLYITWMQCLSLHFHKLSLFHWVFEVQPILKLKQAL